MRRALFLLVTVCTLAVQAVPALSPKESAARQSELKDLRGQLDKLKKELAANESQKTEAADALAQARAAEVTSLWRLAAA